MKYIIGENVYSDVTPVPELPVKPWQEHGEHALFHSDADIRTVMDIEIVELRALCQAQAARIVELEKLIKNVIDTNVLTLLDHGYLQEDAKRIAATHAMIGEMDK